MSQSDPKAANQPVGYKNVELLSADRHQTLGWREVEHPYAFARTINAVPVTVAEFRFLAPWYPIVFAKAEPPMPLAVLSIERDDNLFLNDEGDWEGLAYVPSYIRRYPFIFAQSSDSDQMVLCIDRDAAMLAENTQRPILNGRELSDFGKEALEFCKMFQQQLANTQQFSRILVDNELLFNKEVSVTPDGGGEPRVLGSFIGVDEEKLKSLSGDAVVQLHESGALAAIYTHLVSLQNWQTLNMRAFLKQLAAG